MKKQHGIKSGFTLIELLVVVTILGLLAIVVLPALTAGGDKRLLRGAADRLDTHLKHAAARATGKPRGSAVWLDAGTGTAVFDLNFARMPTGTPHSGNVSTHPNQEKFSHIAIVSQMAGLDGTPVQNGSVVRFDMVPNEFRTVSPTNITFSDGDTKYNATFPYTDSGIDYVVYEPPSGPQITSRPTVMPDRVCVDLASSTIGVHNFGDYASSGSPDRISNLYDRFAICFDVYGKPNEAWGWKVSTATPILLTPGKPIALLCTLAYQSGKDPEELDTNLTLTDEKPGAGYQNPDAFWVVIDPKTGRNLIVENFLVPDDEIEGADETKPPTPADRLNKAQTFIRNDLLAQ